jgi:hypothetical protein
MAMTRREFLVNSLAVGTMRGDLDNLLAHVATWAAASNAGRPGS